VRESNVPSQLSLRSLNEGRQQRKKEEIVTRIDQYKIKTET